MSLGHLTVAENKKVSKTNRVNKMTQELTQNDTGTQLLKMAQFEQGKRMMSVTDHK